MILTTGVYRGWRIAVGIIPKTSGQMFVEMEIVDTNEGVLTAFKSAEDKVIREIFNFPKENSSEFGFFRNKENNGFQYQFMFSVLPENITLYSYLAYIFKCIDNLAEYILSIKKTTEEKKTPPLQASSHVVIFRKGTYVWPAIVEGEHPELLIQGDEKEEHIFFNLSTELIDLFRDKTPEYLQKGHRYKVIEDIYTDEFDGDVSKVSLEKFFSEKLELVVPPKE